ncbi:MAG TPA: helix-turn-helix domain-containing protein [Allosphingosinicella sp.]|jgi:transcriptional regulator with XRE-family HTH domain|uniref:helix-turn-helix domain-containing protein n=1 Tax=Allosphingosinicella sp. TaxID=2823234 RepID=UPI002F2A6141
MSDLDANPGALSIGERLQAAREAKGYSLEDIATRTRVPVRHLQHIDAGEWKALPAITYCIGFVRSYGNAVGLDGTALGAELRELVGGGGSKSSGAPQYEPADPARVPPRSLAIAAGLLALILAIGYLVWRTNATDEPDPLELATAAPPAVAAAPQPEPVVPQPQPQPASAGPVAITAADDVWLRIYEAGGTKLFEGLIKANQRYEVPPTARAPQILTGRPDALRITVGQTKIPPLAPPRQTVADVSLLPQDLLARVQSSTGVPGPAAPPAGIAPGPVAQ